MKTRQNKKGCVILAVILIMAAAVVLYGCFGERMEDDNGNTDIEAQIKQDWQKWTGSDDLLAIIYYGTFNGYVVFEPFTGIKFDISTDFKIAGTIFRGTDLRFFLWKNGDFFELLPAYFEGRLTSDDIRNIGEIYLTMIKDSWTGSESSLNEFLEWYFSYDDLYIFE